MTIDRAKMRWNGWGWIDQRDPTAAQPEIWARMAAALGTAQLPKTPARALETIHLPKIRMSATDLGALGVAIGADNVRTGDWERATHARGKSYHDLLHLRAGRMDQAADAVIYPASIEEIVSVLRICTQARIAVVPFGGGSSVVGGVTPVCGNDHKGVVALDLTRMNKVLEIDETSMTARAEAGIWGADLEAALQARGLTLGHYPQSFEFSTLGGWIAARGAGQQSGRYGKAERWLVSARVATPKGIWASETFPASAAGPRLGDLIVGSEGALGVIAEATIKLHKVPQARDYRGFLFRDFVSGTAAIRAIVQAGIPAAMLRLSDADETYFFRAFSSSAGKSGVIASIAKRYIAMRGFSERPCLLIAGVEGDPREVSATRVNIAKILAGFGALSIGRSPGARWYHGRFAAPYMRDPMMNNGLGIDTLETAASWTKLPALYTKVREALDLAMRRTAPSPGAHGLVMTHISHAYRDGASLYFTLVFPRNLDDEITQWREIKRAAGETIAAYGGTISHHHGVGEDHLPWLAAEKGEVAVNLLRALKREIDPAGILNPGKLTPPEHTLKSEGSSPAS